EIVRTRLRLRHRLPLAPGRKRRPTPPEQPGLSHFANHRLRPHLASPHQRSKASKRPIAIHTFGVVSGDPPKQAPSPPRGEGRGEGRGQGLVRPFPAS